MDLTALFAALAVALVGGLVLDRIRGTAKRVEGKLARTLKDIPDEAERERWWEELRGVLLEFEGRPLKQFRLGRELVRAADRLAVIHTPVPAISESEPTEAAGSGEADAPIDPSIFVKSMQNALVGATPEEVGPLLENLTYRERRVLEMRLGMGEAAGRRRTVGGVAQTFALSPQRVREIETLSLQKLVSLAEAGEL